MEAGSPWRGCKGHGKGVLLAGAADSIHNPKANLSKKLADYADEILSEIGG
jgi:hypothetical protein